MATAKTQTRQAPPREVAEAPANGESAIKKTADLSEEVLEQLQTGQRNAIAAVRRFAGSTDDALPSLGEGHSGPQKIVDSALEMSERLVQVQYDFVRGVVHSVGEALGGSGRRE